MPIVDTFTTALTLVEHLRQCYRKRALSSSERSSLSDAQLEAEAVALLRKEVERIQMELEADEDYHSEDECECGKEHVIALQTERIEVEQSPVVSSSSSSSSSSAPSAPALQSTLLPLQWPFLLVFFLTDFDDNDQGYLDMHETDSGDDIYQERQPVPEFSARLSAALLDWESEPTPWS